MFDKQTYCTLGVLGIYRYTVATALVFFDENCFQVPVQLYKWQLYKKKLEVKNQKYTVIIG